MIEIEKMDSDFDNKLRRLNSAQLGSFGELVFISTFKKMKVSIERYHNDKFDYLINGDPIDVKTTIRNITKEHSKVSQYNGPKVQGVTGKIYIRKYRRFKRALLWLIYLMDNYNRMF